MGSPSVSVVVNTLNRAASLQATLESFRHLHGASFEVVVVAGPCTDDTDAVLGSFGSALKVRRCPVANLSMSRNIGIAAAAGDVVAFIDDDAIPEPDWLEGLASAYADPEVAGAGGVVFDHTGAAFQCRFNSADRVGESCSTHDHPLDHLCVPGAWRFPYLIGTNSSFRRAQLVAVGGFDEEYEFYLDETDVCLRLVDAGWLLRQIDGAPVHHKFLPSHVRNQDRVTVDKFAVVKNRLYFALVNGRPERTVEQIVADVAEFAELQRGDLRHHAEAGRITAAELGHGLERIEAGIEAGLAAGLRGRRVLIGPDAVVPDEGFRLFPTAPTPARRRRLVFVSQFLPPADTSGVGRYLLDTASALARRGHEVRIITTGEGHDRVDLEDGVWVHRILKDGDAAPSAVLPKVPDRVWRNAAAVATEVERLHLHRPVDAVYGAMWDTEMIGVFERVGVPVVTTLVTTLAITLRTRPEWRDDPAWMAGFGSPMLALERWLLDHSDAFHAISHAILEEVERTSGWQAPPGMVQVSPLAVHDHRDHVTAIRPADGRRRVTFLGRFEARKGVDLVLDAAPELLARRPDVELVLMGRDDLPTEHGVTYRERFEQRHRNAPWFDRVCFRGVVDDDELFATLAGSDVFVAPSRFESFGLIFVEAMMLGVPVVALRAGAAPEVVDHGRTGLLVDQATAPALATAVGALLDDPAGAAEMGRAGRRRYEERFTVDRLADHAETLFDLAERLVAERTGPLPLALLRHLELEHA